jgi:predicted enzyme related to lactoylglutathione lyase
MGERTEYTPGTFCWTDLGTSDADGAKSFYGELLGWDFEDMPVGDDQVYSMARVGDGSVAAVYQSSQGPPAWLAYVSVESADAAAERAAELGGRAIAAPFDVVEAGRMAVLQDPQGAVFAAWEPRDSIGATLVNVPGALTITQLNTPDPGPAVEYYTGLFGWRANQVSEEPPYYGLYLGDALNAGLMQMPAGTEAPAHWLVYFVADGLDDSAGRIGELGGGVMVPPTAVPGGRFLVARDPQGAVFALFEGRLDP